MSNETIKQFSTQDNRKLVDAVVTYEELFHLSEEDRITEYFGDYGLHYFKPHIESGLIDNRINAALDAIGCTREEAIANPTMLYRAEMKASMISRMAKKNEQIVYRNIKFTPEKINGICFVGVQLVNCDLRNLTLYHTNFDRAKMQDCRFDGAKLDSCSFYATDICQCSFRHADLYNSTFQCATIFNTNFQFADMDGASLADVKCIDVDFHMISGKVAGIETASFYHNGMRSQEIWNDMSLLFHEATDRESVLESRAVFAQSWLSGIESGKYKETEEFQVEKLSLNKMIQEYQQLQSEKEADIECDLEL